MQQGPSILQACGRSTSHHALACMQWLNHAAACCSRACPQPQLQVISHLSSWSMPPFRLPSWHAA